MLLSCSYLGDAVGQHPRLDPRSVEPRDEASVIADNHLYLTDEQVHHTLDPRSSEP